MVVHIAIIMRDQQSQQKARTSGDRPGEEDWRDDTDQLL
jgi:hypothetical protein